MSPTARRRAAEIAVAGAFAAAAAWFFVEGDERGGPLSFFLAWLAAHLLYGIAAGSFWALAIVVTCPPLFVAMLGDDSGDTALWVQSAFVEAFYGVPVAFVGVVGRRLWELRRRAALPDARAGEDSAE